MRRIVLWVMSTLTMLVLLFSYHTSQGAGSSSVPSAIQQLNQTPSSSSSGTSGSSTSGSSTSGSGSGSSGSSSGTTKAKTYTGDTVMTQYGPVQVKITVSSGKITTAEVLQVPWSNGQDQMINSNAVPILNQEAVDAQSSSIDMVSGATFTSQGYIGSLQSAIDQAHL